MNKYSQLFAAILFILSFNPPLCSASDGSQGASLLVGLPHPISLAWDVRSSPGVSWGGALGYFALPFPVSGYNAVTAGVSNLEGRLRWHPFSGSFFLGGILGFQSLFGKTDQNIDITSPTLTVPMHLELKVTSLFLTPHLGWIWHLGSGNTGFTLGFELGAQLPASPKSELTAETTDPSMSPYISVVKLTKAYQDINTKIDDIGNKLGKIAFPYTALRLGYFF